MTFTQGVAFAGVGLVLVAVCVDGWWMRKTTRHLDATIHGFQTELTRLRKSDEDAHARITVVTGFANDLRDWLADAASNPEAAAQPLVEGPDPTGPLPAVQPRPRPSPGPSTTPTGDAIDEGHKAVTDTPKTGRSGGRHRNVG